MIHTPLLLASASEARKSMLIEAGVPTEAIRARVDEASVKAAMLADGQPPRNIADALAELKAQRIAMKHPDRMVLGADQVLVFDDTLYDKPQDIAEAKEHLLAFRGRTHELLSAAVIYHEGKPVFRHIGRAKLTVRPFSDAFLDSYVSHEADGLLTTVGAYRLEGRGAQLFSRVEGDYFTVLGLPLLEILGFLRARKMIPE